MSDSKMRPVGERYASIILNCVDRYDMTVDCIGKALAQADYPYEFLCCDNGSVDMRVRDFLQRQNPVYLRLNEKNQGIAPMHTAMFKKATGDYFVLADNDIKISAGWLKQMIETYEAVGEVIKPGIAGIYTTALCPEQHAAETANGKVIHPAKPPKEDAIFGTRLFSRDVYDKVGGHCLDYGSYGLADNDHAMRVHYSGFVNFYVDGPTAEHLGGDSGQNTPYRKAKDEALRLGFPHWQRNATRYKQGEGLFIPVPDIDDDGNVIS